MEDGLEEGSNGTIKASWESTALIQVRRDDSPDENDDAEGGTEWARSRSCKTCGRVGRREDSRTTSGGLA